jgi:RNA polymerase sigma factor (TIGR02999 family)
MSDRSTGSPEGMLPQASTSAESVTQMLVRWQQGDSQALGELLPVMYSQLRSNASRHLRRERRDHTLQGTALVHEALLRLLNGAPVQWNSRAHFLRLSSRLMRQILVDHARSRRAAKRNAGAVVVSLDEVREQRVAAGPDVQIDQSADPDAQLDQLFGVRLAASYLSEETDLCAVDEALAKLRKLDERQEQVVELRFFGGLTVEETARTLDISDATVKREWVMARAWLRRELRRAR